MCEWSRRIPLASGAFITVAIRGLRIVITGMDTVELNAATALGFVATVTSTIKDAVKHVMGKDIRGVIADATREDVTPTVGGGDTTVSQPHG